VRKMLERLLLAKRSFKSVFLVLGICLFALLGITMLAARDYNRALLQFAIVAVGIYLLLQDRSRHGTSDE
jgi:hypothetical protein